MEHIQVLKDREMYLTKRIRIKQECGWEFTYDERERNALRWAIGRLDPAEQSVSDE